MRYFLFTDSVSVSYFSFTDSVSVRYFVFTDSVSVKYFLFTDILSVINFFHKADPKCNIEGLKFLDISCCFVKFGQPERIPDLI